MCNPDHGGAKLAAIARSLAGEFGRDRDPEEFRPFVDEWFEGSIGFGIEGGYVADDETWQWFVCKYRAVRTLPGEALAAAIAAMDVETPSIGLPDIRSKDNRANRLARMFRWLNRFHSGAKLFLSYDLVRRALDLPSNAEAGRLAYRLVRAGLLKIVERGTKFDPGLALKDREATTWRWLGPV